MNIQIHNVGFKADEKLISFINKKTGKLEKYFNRITDVDVYLKLENHGKVKDKLVEIILSVPRKKLAAKAEDKVFETGIDECTANLERQLKKYKEKAF